MLCGVGPLAPCIRLSSTGANRRTLNPPREAPLIPTFTRRAALAAAFVLAAGATQAQEIENRLVIVTSFSKDITEPYRAAFQKKYPGTKVEVQNRNTAAAVTFIRETKSNPPDIMWASAPDAFAVLKKDNLLQKYVPKAKGVASKVGSYPINDPEGFFTGFAASGYGIMYNTRYLKANNLPAPKEWADLKKPIYHGHVGFSAPSRSGTSHLTVETILQGEGWDKGWATLLEIGGNFQQVSDRSFGVPDSVNSGQYGIGIVIDFFGLSAKASGFPVEFVYPTVTAIVPANVGIIANAKSPKAAEAFVEFLLSEEGQQILLNPKIQRLPVRLDTYKKAPKDYPNPFTDKRLAKGITFNSELSEERYELLNSLFDRILTFRLKDLNAAWKAIQTAEAKLGAKANATARGLLTKARQLASAVPITEKESTDPSIAGAFQALKKGQKPAGRQAEFETRWDAAAVKNYAEAKALAEKALTAK
jgi:ABC-type Fe3+ transport system substrate-binding protein